MNITKADICKQLLKKNEEQGIEYSPVEIKSILESFLDIILNYLSEDQRIELRGFGSFKVTERKARIGRNPRTGETVPIEAYKEPVFKFSKDAKNTFQKAVATKLKNT